MNLFKNGSIKRFNKITESAFLEVEQAQTKVFDSVDELFEVD